MEKVLQIRDVTLRDGQQSLLSGRLSNEHLKRLLPLYADARFHIVEVWGGSIPESMMRNLGENPWERLRICSEELKDKSLISGLSRGTQLFRHLPYPNYVLEVFYQEAFKNGLNIMRIFDALNDSENLKDAISLIRNLGGTPDAAICFTTEPEIEIPKKKMEKKRGLFERLFGSDETPEEPKKVFADDYYTAKAHELEAAGAGIITLKDLSGLISPSRVFSLMPKLKHAVKVPVDFHTHCTKGYGLASTLTAILKGVDIIDTNIWWLAGGAAAPAVELIWIFCNKLDIPIGVDIEAIGKIRSELKKIRLELSEFDINRDNLPGDFETLYHEMPEEINHEFDRAIQAAGENEEEDLLDACQKIEEYFGFPIVDKNIRNLDIPLDMYAGMVDALRTLHVEDGIEEAMAMVPHIRRDAGMVPLVIPASHIIGAQAVAAALDRRKETSEYTILNDGFVALVRGTYGHTPVEIAPEFRQRITGDPEETPYDTTSFREPANPELTELGGVKLARNNEEFLLLELFPSVAETYLRSLRTSEYNNGLI